MIITGNAIKQRLKKLISMSGNQKKSLSANLQSVASQHQMPVNTSDSKMYVLEPRIMFDAAAVATVAEVTTEHVPPPAAGNDSIVDGQLLVNGLNQTPEITSILFVDTKVKDYQSLIQGVASDVQVVLLDPEKEGVSQIAETLNNYQNLGSIQILSHGSIGEVTIGSSILNNGSLDNYQDDLKRWGDVKK